MHVHLTPEQIDRQPFRMTKRGYDIVEVRNFLREIAAEMRARQQVREQLAEGGDVDAVLEDRAHSVITDAESRAQDILEDAAARAGSVDALLTAENRAAEIVRSAEGVAAQIIEDAESAARERSGEVLSSTQARLDRLLAEERELHARVETLHEEVDGPALLTPVADARDVHPVETTSDSALADLLKSTLRDAEHLDDAV